MIRNYFFCLLFAVLILISVLAVNAQGGENYLSLPKEVPGNYEGKWYGLWIPASMFSREEFKGRPRGNGFPDQKIINSWGYKAKPIEEIKDLLPETYYDICANPEQWGEIRINESPFIPLDQWPGLNQKLFKEATERNKGKAKIDARGQLVNYENGAPFPGTTNAVEMAWNFIFGQSAAPTTYCPNYGSVTDRKGTTSYLRSVQTFFSMKGRFRGEHVPRWEPNPNNYLWFNAQPFTRPYDFRGIVPLVLRYDDPEKQDDQWMYLPVLRRVRRMSTTQRWDKMPGGLDMTYDSAGGFQGKVQNYDWKILGPQVLLCVRIAKDEIQENKGKVGGCGVDELYQRVNTVVLQYIPKIVSTASRGVIYIDPGTYVVYYCEIFDKRGRKYLFSNYTWSVDKDGVPQPCSIFCTDIQRIHGGSTCGVCQATNDDAEKEGVSPSFFEMNSLQSRYGSR